jgi:hypothetical protein
VTAYSKYSQLPFVSGGRLLHSQPEDARSLGDKGPISHYESPGNQAGLQIDGTYQLLVCVDYVNVLAKDINSSKRNAEALIDASKKVSLEVNL